MIKKTILIVIQARSTSTRLPGKSLLPFEDSTVVEHVVRSALNARYILHSGVVSTQVVLAIPEGDPIKDKVQDVAIIEGSEVDVLSRFATAFRKYQPDYMVRLTGDCPLLPGKLIANHVQSAYHQEYDFITNTFPEFRTYVDGLDCEVISRRLFQWLISQDLNIFHKEHVTTYLKKNKPSWAKYAAVFDWVDMSKEKLSVDTKEEYLEVREHIKTYINKIQSAKDLGYDICRF